MAGERLIDAAGNRILLPDGSQKLATESDTSCGCCEEEPLDPCNEGDCSGCADNHTVTASGIRYTRSAGVCEDGPGCWFDVEDEATVVPDTGDCAWTSAGTGGEGMTHDSPSRTGCSGTSASRRVRIYADCEADPQVWVVELEVLGALNKYLYYTKPISECPVGTYSFASTDDSAIEMCDEGTVEVTAA